MRLLFMAAGIAAAMAGVNSAAADPTSLLAPADPSTRSGWRPPASPTAGLQTYRPVAAKDWSRRSGEGTGAAAGKGETGMKDMPGMGSHP